MYRPLTFRHPTVVFRQGTARRHPRVLSPGRIDDVRRGTWDPEDPLVEVPHLFSGHIHRGTGPWLLVFYCSSP